MGTRWRRFPNLLCFNRLLRYPAPHALSVTRAVQSVASDGGLARQLVAHCLDTVLNSQLVDDAPDPKDARRMLKQLAVAPLTAACARPSGGRR